MAQVLKSHLQATRNIKTYQLVSSDSSKTMQGSIDHYFAPLSPFAILVLWCSKLQVEHQSTSTMHSKKAWRPQARPPIDQGRILR